MDGGCRGREVRVRITSAPHALRPGERATCAFARNRHDRIAVDRATRIE